ncbi:hypothetical protein NW768_005739 [Fusarium equiseti]|uniref:Uncharacterized protein n=1 Tax=Fusarium equiseti TaxID=61235 RepID=A0ABQ8RCU2_FUSEQ|nr:hypothetical protein NW768_005739 [Fusarium equiseti]
MPDEPHWSSIRHRRASTEQPPDSAHPRNLSRADNEFNRRLTLGDIGEWLKERQEPAPSVTLGDVGAWFKRKLPSHRPEKGGTLRNKNNWASQELNGIHISQSASKDAYHPPASSLSPEQRLPATNHRTGQRSRTGGSDRLMDWNTPKNLSEALPDPKPPKRKAIAAQEPSTRRKWLNRSSKRNQKTSDSIEPKNDERQQAWGNTTKPQSFAAATQTMPDILEVLDAVRKARTRARDEREDLKESGDYLGVQGINPQTGVLDLTSDSEESGLSLRTEQRLAKLEDQAKNATSAVKRKEAEAEIIRIHLDHDVNKLRRREETEKRLKWRRGTHQWSSVQEPDLSPIAQSHRSTSDLSKRKLRRDYNVTKQEDLIDLDLTDNQRSQGRPPSIAVMTNLHTRESAHSSDTVVKTPHRRGSADVYSYSAGFEPFESDKSSHSMDKLGLDRDLFAEHDVAPSRIYAQAPSDLLSEITGPKNGSRARRDRNTLGANQQSDITGSLGDKPFSTQPRPRPNLDEERMRDAKSSGGHSAKTLHARFDDKPREIHYPPDSAETNRARIPRKPVPTYTKPIKYLSNPDKSRIEPAPNGEPRSRTELGTLEDGRLRPVANSPSSPEASSVKSWDDGRPTTPERGRAVSDSRSPHRSASVHSRGDSVAWAAKSTQDSQRNTRQRRNNRKEPSSTQNVVPNDTRDQRSWQPPDLHTKHGSRHREHVRDQGGVCIHKHHHHYWVRPHSFVVPLERAPKSRECPSQAQTQPSYPEPTILRDDTKQFGHLPDKSWAESIAEIEVSGRDTSDRYYVREPSGIFETRTTGTSVQHGTTSRNVSNAAPMQQFVNIHLHGRLQECQRGGDRSKCSLERKDSTGQRISSIGYALYGSEQNHNESGSANVRRTPGTSGRRRRHRRSFQ